MKTTVIENKGARFLSQFEEFKYDLPDNVFFNKVTTGSGMTTIVLANDVKYVLCVPFKNLVHNKLEWCNNNNVDVIGVYSESEGGATKAQISTFKGNKIITTWDSLDKVVECLGSKVGKWKIMIDEAHQLVHSGSFRTNAVEQVLENYTKFKSFIFGTATPIRDKYQLPALQHLDKVEIKWDNLDIVNVHYTKYDKDLNRAAAVLAVKYLTNEIKGNAHIFINSVKSIASIIRHIKKSGNNPVNDLRIVCSDTERNKQILKESLGSKYQPSSINSDVKRINFYTSTAFEGCDIYDKEGKTYIISDGGKDHSKIDILTALPQIIARVRDASVKNFVELWFTPNRYYSHTSEEQFEQTVKNYLEQAKVTVEDYNRSSELTKTLLLSAAEESAYLRTVDGVLKVNDTALYAEMNAFNTLHRTYYVSNSKELSAKTVNLNTIDYSYKPVDKVEIKGLNKVQIGKSASFADICLDYFEAVEGNNFVRIDRIKAVEPIILEAYEKLGEEKMRALELRRSDIEDALAVAHNLKSNDWKIVKLLKLRVGQWISNAEAKEKIQEVYDTLDIDKKAKATDLSNWYEVEGRSKRIDSKKVAGINILANLIKLS